MLRVSLWLGALLAGLAPVSRADTIYVATTGLNTNDGLSWATAKKTVAGGLAAAASGDQVWVAAGTYVERVTLKVDVGLYGGLAGDEPPTFDLSQRSFASHPTILDGNANGSVVTSPSGATTSTRIDGFVIRNGKAPNGGGIYCYDSSPAISNNTIIGNVANSIPALGGGGGIYCGSNASPAILDNTITGNSTSGSGGGISCSSSSPAISNNAITGNHASSGSGGGIYCNASSPAISNNSIVGNGADSGGGICCSSTSSPAILNNRIIGNSGGSTGGGIQCSSSAPAIANNTITGNSASSSGGGIYCTSSSPAISNNIVAFNSSGMYRSGGTPKLRNNCVYNPSGANYSGLAGGAGDISVDPQLLAASYGEVHLAADSPCIDAGLDSTVQAGWADMDGEVRIQGAHVDIGADEFNGTTPSFTPAIVRISPSGNDADDGSSWTSAKRTVQGGIDAVASAGGGDVWVAAGTYGERIALRTCVHVYGGFAGWESSRDERNWIVHPAVLDGGGGGSVVTASFCGHHLSMIDGFTIRSGSASAGGGVYCSCCSPAVAHNTITGNSASGSGGGIYCSYASPTIFNNTITGNSAGFGSGGGICCSYSSPAILNNTITGNSVVAYGGGICGFSSSPAISNNIVAFNSSGLYSSGGAPALRHNCVYNPNVADYSGLTAGADDISVDPQLQSVGCGEVHLKAGSPCIDAGLDDVVQPDWADMDGEPRIQGAQVDIGADEFDGTTPLFTLKIVRVSSSGSDANDGSSWALAKRTVQGGIEAAASAGGGDVWVAAGTYGERIALRTWVHVYGGFEGTESGRDERSSITHTTVLDGAGGGSVVTALSIPGYASSTIDGFTIRNGTGTSFGSNPCGGGIYCSYSSPTISNNTIIGNSASGAGGGICCSYSSSPISSNTIAGNSTSAGSGGGIYCYSSSPAIFRNTITGNSADGFGGTGGGICCSSSSACAVTIFNNRINGNRATYMGGGINCTSCPAAVFNNTITGNSGGSAGGGIRCSSPPSTAIVNNTIAGNGAGYGGAILCEASSPVISSNLLAFNSSGLYSSGGTPTLRNNCVYNPSGANYSGLAGGAGDISVDPQLLAASYGEVHLAADSPCIDAGLDSTVQAGWADMDGEVRIQGEHVDIGADEFNGTTPSFAPAIVRVSPSGNDADDGSSWTSAKRTVQGGIDAVASAGGGDVWVAAGTYGERITLRTWAHVYGGFAGTESSRDQRSWFASVTILDGGAGGSVVTASAPGYGSSVIDGFTIRNGSGTGSGSYGYGGGIYCSGSSPAISNNLVTGNSAGSGGGIYCINWSSPMICNNTITGNNATSSGNGYGGGGMFCDDSFPVISSNTIAGNTSGSSGGGVYCSSSSPVICNNKISGNTANNQSGIGGGGIYCWYSSPTISNNAITGNRTISGGGGIRCDSSSPAISNNTISGNTGAGSGDGIYCSASYPAVSNNIVAFNSSGLFSEVGAPTLRNNCIYNPAGVNYSGLSAGVGDIWVDPLLVNWQAGNCHLAPGSPCIDAGYNAAVPSGALTDLDGRVRFFDDPTTPDCQWSPGNCGTPPIVDMGACEYGAPCGDFDEDGDVDLEDFGHLQVCLTGRGVTLTDSRCRDADLDGDEDVDSDDVSIFIRYFNGPNKPPKGQ